MPKSAKQDVPGHFTRQKLAAFKVNFHCDISVMARLLKVILAINLSAILLSCSFFPDYLGQTNDKSDGLADAQDDADFKFYQNRACDRLASDCDYLQLANLDDGSSPLNQPWHQQLLDYRAMSESVQTSAESPINTIPAGNLWDRIRNGMQLDHAVDKRRTKIQLKWYASHQQYMDRVSTRADRYMFYIVEELERRNMPMEIALLPIVESAFDPFAYSHGRAAGMWQFIPSTGRMFGLKQNWWYDGRRDVVASTNAALDYLQSLHKHFKGDWLHALAAYNSGQGKVGKAIRRNRKMGKPTDFWSLKLPKETQAYVPKLLALGALIADNEKYSLFLKPIADTPYFAIIDTQGQIDLAQASAAGSVEMDELYRLNPGYNRWATDPKGPHRLLVPVAKAQAFAKGIAGIPADKRVGWERHTIKSGENLISIARRYGTKPDVLEHVNGLKGHLIRAGKTLLVPVAQAPLDSYVLSADSRLARIQNRTPGADSSLQKINYTVRKGDSFWSIGRKFGVGTKKLARWNGMGIRDTIVPGKNLVIWEQAKVDKTLAFASMAERKPMIRRVGYRVRSGDSLAKIAGKFNIRISDIEKWNTLNRSKYIQPGQPLTLFVDVTNMN